MERREVIVVIEDDPAIADLIEMYLRQDGFDVHTATSGERGLEIVEQRDPCLVVLDLGLAGSLDGLQVCRSIREQRTVPIVMVTARGDEVDRVVGLELGADDYVPKPFSPRELIARIRAVLRRVDLDGVGRSGPSQPDTIDLGDLAIDRARHEVSLGGDTVSLTAREFDLLVFLAENRGLALSRRQLIDGVWGFDWVGDERTVDVHVRQLRRKLEPALELATVRGLGYRLD